MKLLLNTSSANEDFDGCEWAFVDLNQKFERAGKEHIVANIILKRLAHFETLRSLDPDLMKIEFWDFGPIWIDEIPEKFDSPESIGLGYGESFVEIDATPEDFESVAARTECDRMVLTREDVYWRCYPKHADYESVTRPIDYETVRKAAAENREANHGEHA